MTKEELEPIDVKRYKVTETGQVLKMTELEKEARDFALEWGDKTDGTYACCRDGYLAGAEPREKRIAELEEELAHLKIARNNCEQQYQYKVYELGVELGVKVSNLIVAKAIITSLIDDLEIIGGEQTRELKAVKEAEQFLNSEVSE